MPKRILLVEDEPKNMKLLRDLLQKFGYETVEAADGEEGVELTRKIKPDLILMDIMMPKLDGLEATRILKTDVLTRDIPIVALTAFAMSGDKERAFEAGCDGYITKPVDVHGLLKTVEQFLAR
jgi:two-component system cell cycle response regulator DivK